MIGRNGLDGVEICNSNDSFKASVAQAAALSCGQKAVGACHGCTPRTNSSHAEEGSHMGFCKQRFWEKLVAAMA